MSHEIVRCTCGYIVSQCGHLQPCGLPIVLRHLLDGHACQVAVLAPVHDARRGPRASRSPRALQACGALRQARPLIEHLGAAAGGRAVLAVSSHDMAALLALVREADDLLRAEVGTPAYVSPEQDGAP